MILVDSDVLVALVDRGDRRHRSCVEALRTLREPLATVWPVLDAALTSVKGLPAAQSAILEMVARGAVRILPLGQKDVAGLRQVLTKPRRAGVLSVAHAALVLVAERDRVESVFTLAGAQLGRGRVRGRQALRVLP